MIKRSIALGALSLSVIAHAETHQPPITHTFSGSVSLLSSYRFRGLDQTDGKPALQVGIEYAHESGFYLGNANSNVQPGAGYPSTSLEMDFYGGFKKSFGDLGIDAGLFYYSFPGSSGASGRVGTPTNPSTQTISTGAVDNLEAYLALQWRFIRLKYSHALIDYFSIPETQNTRYLDLSFDYPLGSDWTLSAHVGELSMHHLKSASYIDWSLGISKTHSDWRFGLAYIGTNADGDCATSAFYCFSNAKGNAQKDAGRATLIVSITRAF